MTPITMNIEQKLQQLSELTASDLTAIGVVDPRTRKLQWHPVIGSISKRTEKIRQHIHAGLTGEVLRTGSFLQCMAAEEELFDIGEAIMLTEKLYHAAAWPLCCGSKQYSAAILIGRRAEGGYEPQQINEATQLVEQLAVACSNDKCN